MAQGGTQWRVESELVYCLSLRSLVPIFLLHITNSFTLHFIWSLGTRENMEKRPLNGIEELY